jgi:hypothetical protein
MPDGKCGTLYTEPIEFSDGVAPFKHHVVLDVGSDVMLKGAPGTPDGVAKGSADSAYAAETDEGPAYDKRFPEGLYLVEATGICTGIPRRRGTFVDWTYHIQSASLPSVASQNVWRNFTFSMAPGTPPAMTLSTAVLAPGNTSFSPPNNLIPELEITKPYTAQFAAVNGVPMDGRMDAPHDVHALPDPTEEAGKYAFFGDFGLPGIPAGMSFSIGGTFSGTPTQKSGFRTIALTVEDEQLPTSVALGFPNTATGSVRFTVGPDAVIISETLAGTSSTTYDDVAYAFGSQTIEVFEPFSGSPSVRPLDDAKDMVANHSHPLGGTLADSLSSVDLLQTSVNPTWWADDVMNLNSKGARAGQGDWHRRFPADTVYSDFFRRIIGGGGSMPLNNSNHAPNVWTELPELAPGVVLSATSNPPVNGIYRDGGQLYGYDGAEEFGFFIVRKDAKIEIPVAFAKPAAGGTYTGFGDGWVSTNPAHPAAIRRPQITVSPDGRFAAVKVKVNVATFTENAATSKVVLFSLTGEKPFAGSSFVVINAGSGGTSASGGTYLYGDTLTLTNRFLYFLCGDYEGVSNGNLVIYSRHYVYRYEITGGAASAALLSGGSISTSLWTNTNASPLAVPYHKWMTPGASSIASSASTGIAPYALSFTSPTGVNPHFFTYNYANFSENSMAPHPFRVNAAGNACAILAAPDSFAGFTGTNFMKYYLFVDYDSGSGLPTLREVGGSVARRYGSPSRIGGFAPGQDTASFYSSTSTDRLYGWYDGPATQLEISDDGKRVAVVYNESTSSWTTGGINNETTNRENLLVFTGGGSTSDPWSSSSARAVTSSIFINPYYWRFGCVQFTRDNNGVVFWGGFSNYDGNAGGSNGYRYYMWPGILSGTLYACDLTVGTTTVTSILQTVDGGGNAGITSYTSASPVSMNSFVNFDGSQGSLQPMGGFVSNDGRFYYLRSWCSLSSSDPTVNRVVGVNVSAASSNTINGRTAMRGFAPGNWPSRYGWGMEGYYGLYGGMPRWHRGLGGALALVGQQVSAARNGLVFFTGAYQAGGPTDTPYAGYDPNNSTYYYPGGPHPYYYADYGLYGGDLYAIDANVGGNVVKISNFGSSTQYRIVNDIRTTPDGNAVSVTFNLPTPSPYDSRPQVEKLARFAGISTNASGAITVAGGMNIEDTMGRVSASVAHDLLGVKLYYGFTTSSNENNMLLIEKKMNATGTSVVSTLTQGGILGGSGGQARFAVLYAGR